MCVCIILIMHMFLLSKVRFIINQQKKTVCNMLRIHSYGFLNINDKSMMYVQCRHLITWRLCLHFIHGYIPFLSRTRSCLCVWHGLGKLHKSNPSLTVRLSTSPHFLLLPTLFLQLANGPIMCLLWQTEECGANISAHTRSCAPLL